MEKQKQKANFKTEIDMLVKRVEKIKQQGEYIKPPAFAV